MRWSRIGTRSAGRAPEQLVDTAALALGRTARATVPGRHPDSLLAGRRGRAVVDVARDDNRCADTSGDACGRFGACSPRTRQTRSAGRAPEQLLDTPALALGRTARAAVPGSHRDSLLAGRRGRAVVGVARGGNRCADTLGDDLPDDHDAFTSLAAQPHLVTGPYGMRGLDPDAVDPDVPGPAGTRRGRTGRGQPHRPDPAVHPPSLITCHPPNCNAIRARCGPKETLTPLRRPCGCWFQENSAL